MRTLFSAAVILMFSASLSYGATCNVKAAIKDGKPLAGSVKASSIHKCKKDACEPRAVSADGKKLSGVAKSRFLKKCLAAA